MRLGAYDSVVACVETASPPVTPVLILASQPSMLCRLHHGCTRLVYEAHSRHDCSCIEPLANEVSFDLSQLVLSSMLQFQPVRALMRGQAKNDGVLLVDQTLVVHLLYILSSAVVVS